METALEAAATAAIPIIFALVFRWLQTVVGESNSRLLASAAKQAVLGIEEGYLAGNRGMNGREKRDAAVQLVIEELDQRGKGVIPMPVRHSRSVEHSKVVDAVEAIVHELFNSPDKKLAHAEALQRVTSAALAQTSGEVQPSDHPRDPQEELERVTEILVGLGLKPRGA